ncbi:FAD-dependent oxidoreductase [Mesosutterella sp. AGMB02718]|uniref:FAD-dependent oxidoreductase n=1 Tax=Mesosutterella faecium TaxID=2925194 RepID=A0ABT7INV5_9BURK|nr:FAD-dependent oxidoreductase [Mesosutterella sp. AGMB02718]MDL2060072.1 FAD-dependent oxidoreductase [Mesosutterella sp. AGMB02718]
MMKLNRTLPFVLLAAAGTALAYTPGTYRAEYPGQNGMVPVTVTFSKNKIEKIVVGENKETVGIGQTAVKKLPGRIQQYQSLGVDRVSGATVSSVAILQAVANCVEQAGGDVNALLKPVRARQVNAKKTLSSDLVVIGGGAAGMIAAINASQQGLKVILLEKQEFLGGASSICGGVVDTEGSAAQRALGEKTDTPTKFAFDLMANGQQKNDLSGLTFYAENLGRSIDWVVSQGVQLDMKKGFAFRAEHKTPRVIPLLGGCPRYAQTLREVLGRSRAKVMLSTRATDLITRKGAVTGVRAKASDGTSYTIKSKAVLLATGGYGYNKEMLQGDLKSALYYGPVSSTGDGHKMAEKAGAAMQLMEYGKIYPQGIESSPGIAKSTLQGNNAAYDNSGILVDLKGRRVVNEKGTGHAILSVLLKQPKHTLFLLMDKPSFEAFRSVSANNGISQTDIDQWLKNNGSQAPLFIHGETLKEAADRAGIDSRALEETVSRYNSFVKNGKDEDFSRPVRFMKKTISGKGPYYIVEQKPRFATTMGGVVLDTSLHVLDKAGRPIPHLYAAGEVGNSVHGTDSAPGANVGWGITSGKSVSDVIVKEIRR